MLILGTLLHGRYRVERLIARGGMGTVYQARHEVLNARTVAIKEMELDDHDTRFATMAIAQFQQEARFLATLDHPGLVRVLDYFEESNCHYLVMEYVEGRTLETFMMADAFVPLDEILRWADEMCDVIGYLHRQQVLYRDLKPSNVMLDGHGAIRLLDFGIARKCDDGRQTGTFIRGAGTPGYAPVEQFGAGSTDPRTDIYSLGATIYSLLTRTVPPLSIDLLSGDAVLVRPQAINRSVPQALEDVLLRMLAVNRVDRPASIDEVRDALRRSSTQPQRVRKAEPQGPSTSLATPIGPTRRSFEATPGPATVPPARPLPVHVPLGVRRVKPRERILQRLPAHRPTPQVVSGVPTLRLEDDPRIPPKECKWVQKLDDAQAETHVKPPPKFFSTQCAPIWLWQLAITLSLLALSLPYYSPAFHLGALSVLNLPALLTGKVLSLMLDHSGAVAALATLFHLGVPMLAIWYFQAQRRPFASMIALVWLSANILELAVCLRYAHVVGLPFAEDFARCFEALQRAMGLSAIAPLALQQAMRAAGLCGLFGALGMMLWRLVQGNGSRRTR